MSDDLRDPMLAIPLKCHSGSCHRYNFCVATKVLSRPAYFRRDKRRDKHVFVATKMIHVAAAANSSTQ